MMMNYRLRIMLIVSLLLAVAGSMLATDGMYIRAVTPRSGPPGTVVAISGRNFGATQGTRIPSINLCQAHAMPVLSWSDTLIRVRVPAGLFNGAYKVLIYYDSSRRTSSNSVDFQVTGAPRRVPTRYEGAVTGSRSRGHF